MAGYIVLVLSDVLARVAHDLKSPFSIIAGKVISSRVSGALSIARRHILRSGTPRHTSIPVATLRRGRPALRVPLLSDSPLT